MDRAPRERRTPRRRFSTWLSNKVVIVPVTVMAVLGLSLSGATPASAAIADSFGPPTVECSLASTFGGGLIGPIGVRPNFLPLATDGLGRIVDYEQMYYQPWVKDL